MERNRAKYPHINDAELASRKAFVSSMREQLMAMKSTVNGRRAQGKMEQDKHSMLTARRLDDRSSAKAPSRIDSANADFIEEQKQSQAMLVRQQDEHLDGIDRSVMRLNEVAVHMNENIARQNKEIDEMAEETSEVQQRMDSAMKHIQKLLKTKNKCQLWTIFFLILVLLVVTIMVAMG